MKSTLEGGSGFKDGDDRTSLLTYLRAARSHISSTWFEVRPPCGVKNLRPFLV